MTSITRRADCSLVSLLATPLSFVETVVKGRAPASRTSCRPGTGAVSLSLLPFWGHRLVPWVFPPSPSPGWCIISVRVVHMLMVDLGPRAGGKPQWAHVGMSALARGRSNLLSRMEAPLVCTRTRDLGPDAVAGSPACSVCTCAHKRMEEVGL